MSDNKSIFRSEIKELNGGPKTVSAIIREELKEETSTDYSEWTKLIEGLRKRAERIRAQKGIQPVAITGTLISRRCSFGKNMYTQIRKGEVNNRRYLLELLAFFGVPLKQTNDLIVRHTSFAPVYPRFKEDFVWAYMLNNGPCECPERTFPLLLARLEKIVEDHEMPKYEKESNPTDSVVVIIEKSYGRNFDECVEDALDLFSIKNKLLAKIYQRVDFSDADRIEAPSTEFKRKGAETEYIRSGIYSAKKIFSEYPEFLSRLNTENGYMRKRKDYYPERYFIIALAIHLYEDVDDVLDVVKMKHLGCVTNAVLKEFEEVIANSIEEYDSPELDYGNECQADYVFAKLNEYTEKVLGGNITEEMAEFLKYIKKG